MDRIMKKLHLEDVRVESFELGAKQDARGTVVANGRTDVCTAFCTGDCGGVTIPETCQYTCNVTACGNDCMSAVYFLGECTMP
ncbi:MAG TPA: hypothetical protein VGC13_18095 [Longimicrobium sp.]|jgi:hypothetical protein